MKHLPIFLILIFAFFLRIYGLNWDQGFHLHPDERAIVLASLPLQFPITFSEFLSVQSPLNPHFFAYGSLPMYLLKGIAVILTPFYSSAATYDHINLIGRFLSAVFDTGAVFLIFVLGKKLFSKTIGLLASFFYSISVFPIQTAHFYAVDTPLTFLILLTLYVLILFYEKPSKKRALIVGFLIGASLATKTSALVLIVSVGIVLLSEFILIFIKNPHKPKVWFPHIPKFIKILLTEGLLILIVSVFSFLIFEPYALLDSKEFLRKTVEQSQMTHNAFAFPFTLQYVGKIPYFYELKNIFFWGQGPILATISLFGIFYTALIILKKKKERKWAQELILIIFLLSYFGVVGKFAVGWMRYMLPLYPLFCLFGAVFVGKFFIPKINLLSRYFSFLIFNFSFLILLIWPLSFMHTYTKPNTRVLASNWINKNIPIGSTIATEHWDDGLPLGTQTNYKVLELPMYEPETSTKWDNINQTLKQTNYIIIASNRLYAPLMRLTDCKKLPPGRCYTKTAQYYQNLFDGKLGFKKAAEFTVYPKFIFPLAKWEYEFDDSSADESFTVYDHPKILIFQKIP